MTLVGCRSVLAAFVTASITLTLSTSSASAEPGYGQIFTARFGAGCVDTTLETGAETFAPGTYTFLLIDDRHTSNPNQFGWYSTGNPSQLHPIFLASDTLGDERTVSIPVQFGLYLDAGTVFRSETDSNPDEFDHFVTFDVCGGRQEVAIGIEDGPGGGDGDFNDHVVSLAPLDGAVFELRRPEIETYLRARAVRNLGPGGAKSISGNIGGEPGPFHASGAVAGTNPVTVEVIRNPCADESIAFDVVIVDRQFWIEWDSECVFPGEAVLVFIQVESGPLTVENAVWKDAGGTVVAEAIVTALTCTGNRTPDLASSPPVCESILEVKPGQKVAIALFASDLDTSDDVEIRAVGLPAGATFARSLNVNPATGAFHWTPEVADIGDHEISFIGSDPCRAEDTCRVTIRVVNRSPHCSGARASRPTLWPPNHELFPVHIEGVTDPDGDPIQIAVTSVTQDEPLNGTGDGNTCPDAELKGDHALLRAERSGGGNGRVYEVSFTATDGTGNTCAGRVAVCVPHDMDAPTCVDDGQTVNSTDPCPIRRHRSDDMATALVAPIALELRPLPVRGSRAELDLGLPEARTVEIVVLDVTGRNVATVERVRRVAGWHQISWSTAGLAPGTYFYRVRAGDETASRAFVVLK